MTYTCISTARGQFISHDTWFQGASEAKFHLRCKSWSNTHAHSYCSSLKSASRPLTTTQDRPDSQSSPDQTKTNGSVWSLFDSNFPSTNQWLNYTVQDPNRSKQKKTKLIGWGRICRVRFQACLTESELQVMHSAVRRTTQLHQEYLICRSRLVISGQLNLVRVYWIIYEGHNPRHAATFDSWTKLEASLPL